MLEPAALEEFQEIVGKANVDDSDVMRDIYAYNWCMELVNAMEGKEPVPFSCRPAAVILPGTTEEVSRVVKACRKHGLKFKAQSTGLGPWNNPTSEKTVILDLRRMNRIVKIDPENMLAVVEPYVSGAQLQAELMKFGLNCHMPGAGPQVSPLASATSMNGPGFTSASTGYSGRNVLGVEWVLPDGTVLRLGSLGMKDHPDWFTGDGPGFSLRGVMRGLAGAKSGLGVFTRVAIKLFPFPCDVNWDIKGRSPDYTFNVPARMRFFVFDCKTYEKAEEVVLQVEQEEISFMCSVLSGFGVAAIFSNSIESLLSKTRLGTMKVPVVVIIAGRTDGEFSYKNKVMESIIEEHGLENVAGNKFKVPSIVYAEALRSNLGLHGFIATGAFQSTHGGMDTLKMCLNLSKKNIPLKRRYIKKGQVANDFGEAIWSTSYEHGHMFHVEMLTLYDQTNEYSIEGMAEYCDRCNELDLVQHLGIPFFIEGDERHEWYGPHCSNYHVWLRKVKATFDPDDTADSGFYISPGTAARTASKGQRNDMDNE